MNKARQLDMFVGHFRHYSLAHHGPIDPNHMYCPA
jgi:hypothetical protein